MPLTEVWPAMDLIEGRCVRLRQGDFNQCDVYSADPVAMALKFFHSGFKHLHLVDLDGARTGEPRNLGVAEKIAKETGLSIDFSGGIRSAEQIGKILRMGISQVCCGSVAVENPNLFKDWLKEFGPEKVVLAADVRGGKVAFRGWRDDSALSMSELLEQFLDAQLTWVLCTSIECDGLLKGGDTGLYRSIVRSYPGLRIVASGGVRDRSDLVELSEAGVSAVIVGRAIYAGTLRLEEAVNYVG